MKYAVFKQMHFYYKINLQSQINPYWYGSRICVKKYLKSPQWLRDLKFKKRPFWRLDKIRQNNIVSLIKRFEGVINAAESKYVMLNAHSHSTEIICKLLPGADSPTIIPLQKDNKVAIHALCKEPVFWETMEKLKLNGASSILVLPVEKILN